MVRWIKPGLVLALGVSAGFWPAPAARAQVRERDVTITGPRGRSIERHFESRLGPNGLDRQMTIRRPGGTFERDVHIGGRPPAFVGGPRGFVPGPRGPVFLERDVIINRGGGGNALGAGLLGAALGTGAGMILGSAISTPRVPPPTYVVPPPVYVTPAPAYVVTPPPPVVVANPPVQVQPLPAPDEVSMAVARLQSNHEGSRRDACAVLGRLGDDRAVPSLVDRLKYDPSKHVRAAAATAIGQIGDPDSAVILQRAITYDKKHEVRDAAAAALAMMPRPTSATVQAGSPATTSEPALEPAESVPPLPVPANARR